MQGLYIENNLQLQIGQNLHNNTEYPSVSQVLSLAEEVPRLWNNHTLLYPNLQNSTWKYRGLSPTPPIYHLLMCAR